MMKKKKPVEEETNNRRAFLRAGLTGAAALAAGAVGLNALRAGEPGPAGEMVRVLTPDGKLVEVEKSALKPASPFKEAADRKEAMKGIPDRKFVMVVDLAKCKNARKCVEACQHGHFLPKDHEWIKIYLLRDSEETAPYWFPRPCFHCDNPMCVSVCPVGATYKRSDGIVLVDNHRCIGCKFCMTGCPYSARVFHWKEPEVEQPDVEYSPETNVPAQEGTVGKCVWCADLLRQNKLPRCVSACPMGALYFGDLVEDAITNGTETVRFTAVMEQRAGYRYREELGTLPGVFYLPPVNRLFPVERGLDGYDEDISGRYNGILNEEK